MTSKNAIPAFFVIYNEPARECDYYELRQQFYPESCSACENCENCLQKRCCRICGNEKDLTADIMINGTARGTKNFCSLHTKFKDYSSIVFKRPIPNNIVIFRENETKKDIVK